MCTSILILEDKELHSLYLPGCSGIQDVCLSGKLTTLELSDYLMVQDVSALSTVRYFVLHNYQGIMDSHVYDISIFWKYPDIRISLV
jgi:hypothetical protein